MFVNYRTQAIVLGRKNINEADSLIYFFTKEYGLLKILGKSIRKISSKLKSGARDFNFEEIEFVQGKKLKILTDIYSVKKIARNRQGLKKEKTLPFYLRFFYRIYQRAGKRPEIVESFNFFLADNKELG